MYSVNRRDVLQVITTVGMVTAMLESPAGKAQPVIDVNPAFSAGLDLKALDFAPDALDGLSATLINSHWQNNYGGSVRALNIIKERLQVALADDALPAYVYNDLKREHLLRNGSVVLHEYYFANIAPPQGRDSGLDTMLTQAFGSVAGWEREFKRIGSGLGGGSGWVMLAWNTHMQTLENFWMGDHAQAPAGAAPLLVMDMYEHSYHMDYGAAAGQYIDAFMRNINWATVALRLDLALRSSV